MSSGNFWLLPFLNLGQHGAVYTSWAGALASFVPNASQFSAFTYNPEHWANTPDAEQNNLVATVQQASSTIHGLGLPFMVVPDQSFDQALDTQLAPYVDIYGLQGERFETDLTKFQTIIAPEITAIRAANPNVKIYIQVGTQFGTAQQMADAVAVVIGQADGIMIWTTPGAEQVVQDFFTIIRS